MQLADLLNPQKVADMCRVKGMHGGAMKAQGMEREWELTCDSAFPRGSPTVDSAERTGSGRLPAAASAAEDAALVLAARLSYAVYAKFTCMLGCISLTC